MPEDEQTCPERRRRFRFSLRQLLVAVALIAVAFGTWRWLFHKVVVVRAATPEDKVSESYFGFRGDGLKARNIAVASGTFTRRTWLISSLYLVEAGTVVNGTVHFAGRTSNEVAAPIWRTLNIRLALGERDVPGGRVVCLGMQGFSRGGGHGDGLPHNFKAVATKTLPGQIMPGRPYIVYVEGDQKMIVDRKMTVEEFAKANQGNYLVVTVELQ